MFGENLLNAKQLAKKLGVGNTTVFKLLKQKNNSGQANENCTGNGI